MSRRRACLVTGALGQDGFILCRRLREMGVDVVGVARPGSSERAPHRILTELGCRIIEVDLTDARAAAEVVATVRPARIFHLAAAHHSAEAGEETPDLWRTMLATNFMSCEAMARAAVESGLDAAFIYASSSQIWTARESEQWADESTQVDPATFYGRTKIWAAELLHQYRKQHGLRASVAILFNHESPWRSPSFVTRKITLAAARAAAGEHKPLALRNIGARVDWQAATDAMEALLLMSDSTAPEDYVVASGTTHTVREFVEIAYRRVGLDWRDFVTAERDEAGCVLIGAPARAIQVLGWRPKVTFNRLVASMVDADVARIGGGSPW